jgi:hypothetical protein
VSLPLLIAPGTSVAVPIRFQPAALGRRSGTITVFSDDPASPATVAVSGVAPAPRLTLAIADAGNFGACCVGSFVDEPLLLFNSGACTLTVTAITSSAGEFLAPQVLTFPFTIEAGNAVSVPIRFQPSSLGAKSATITVASDDPAGPHQVTVIGDVPSGKLTITGSAFFGGVKACCREERTISICNVGDCKLNITSVAFKHKNRHWKLINNPFPATLHPGSCLSVVIRYKATEKFPRSCDLVITSDDPTTPVKTLEVVAYTIWSDCCGCKKCCEDCRKGACEKRQCDPCCKKCCDDRDDEEDEDEDGGG